MPIHSSRALLLDAAVAVALATMGLLSLLAGPPGSRPADPLGVLLVVVGATAVVFRQRFPLTVLGVTVATSLAVLQLDYHQSAGGLTVLWALHAVGTSLRTGVAVAAVGATVGMVQLVLTTAPAPTSPTDRISTSIILVAGWGLGLAGRSRRERYDALGARATAERAASLAEQRALLAEERAGIAREMQDLVAHDLAEVTVQVAAARRVVRRDPGAAEQLLVDAEGAARTVVAEVRRILTLLTDPESDAARVGEESHRPVPGLKDLDRLVTKARAAGLRVTMVEDPEGSAPVAPGPALLAYRLVEQALARAEGLGATSAGVHVVRSAGGLRVEVSDDAPFVGDRSLSHLEALRRRAELYGGNVAHVGDRTPEQEGRPGTSSLVLEIPAVTSRSRQ